MFRQKGDEVIRASYSQRVLMDVLDAARRPDSYAVMLLDMSAAEAFRDEYRKKHGVSLSTVHLIVKTLALTIEKEPWLNYMVDGYKIIKPATIDIGVSVVAQESIAPVVVIQEANRKSLKEISEELKQKAAEAMAKEKENMETLNRIGRWLPFNFVRRPIVRFLAKQYRIRRMTIGTAQVTSIGLRDLAFHLPSHIGTTVLASIGGVAPRPVAVGDCVEVRPTLYIVFQIDQRVMRAVEAVKLFRHFRRLIEHPEKLDQGGDSDE
jgi:pyruvate/2-oxoglutarate dehydrogenase complex dihydrolipoamide acyltransferase (E2) component